MTATKTVIFERLESDIAVLTLNRPDVRNAIDLDMIESIERYALECNKDRNLKVLIITGAGKAFCSGGNVKDMHTKSDLFAGSAYAISQNYHEHIQRIPLAMQSLKMPVIGAINGAAYGAGCDLAMMCDLRVAAESATFAESFIKLGLIPGDGGAWFLPRVLSYPRAAELLFTGKPISAQQAYDWGMVNQIAPDDQLREKALALAESIAAHPVHSIRMSKQLLQESEQATLPSLLRTSAALQAIAHKTHDHEEAVAAFIERRDPQFTGN